MEPVNVEFVWPDVWPDSWGNIVSRSPSTLAGPDSSTLTGPEPSTLETE